MPAQTALSSDYTIVDDKSTLPLLSADLSQRKTLKIRLSNGLEVYLISDPKIDQSGALLSVRVGSWEDPEEYPGIAHFLEHMLFMGTKKYPKEAEYQKFINEHGGSANAFTTDTFTSYMFSIDNNSFVEALDRFSDFFKEPLFNPSGVNRELQAIDQEYAKNLENDDWRMMYVDKEVANPEHPYHRFNMGNSSTLNKVAQKSLIDWYKKHYSANLMRVIVYSPLPMDQLRDLVVADFKDVPNTSKEEYTTDLPVFIGVPAAEMVYIEPIKNKRTLVLMWELPHAVADMKDEQPWTAACYVLGHEGEESLLAQLKREDLAEKIQCGANRLGAHNVELYLEIELTDAGVAKVNEVIAKTFQAIANLKDKGIPRYLFDEIQRMAQVNYQYQTREETFSFLMKHGMLLSDETLDTYPEQTYVIQKYNPEATKRLFYALTPQTAHYYLIAPDELSDITFTKKEKWLGAAYTVKPIAPALIEEWSLIKPDSRIDLPAVNPFIPKKLNITSDANTFKEKYTLPHPETIISNDKGKVYFAQDTYYRAPQIYWFFEIKTPQALQGNAQKVVLADIYVKSITDALKKFSYPASLAGLQFEVKRTQAGISIEINGYSENAELLFDEINKQLILHATAKEPQFELYKDSLKREYNDFFRKSPLQQSMEVLRALIYEKFTTSKQKAAAIEKVTYDKYDQYLSTLFEKTYVEGVLYGNMQKQQAEALVAKLLTALDSQPGPVELELRPEVIELSDVKGPFVIETNTKALGNAVILAIELPSFKKDTFDFKVRAAQQVLMQAIDTPFFSTLRTKQQTGYIVYSDANEAELHLFNLFAVQSNTHAVRDLLARFELFIEGYLQEMPHELSEENFNSIKDVLVFNLEQPPKDVEAMGELLHKIGFEYRGDFDWINKRISGIKELTYADFMKMSLEALGRQNKKRVAIFMKGQLPKENMFNYTESSLLQVRKLSDFTTIGISENVK